MSSQLYLKFYTKIEFDIKSNNKPVFIEYETFRWLEHCGPNWDDELGYRKKGELKKWMDACPIKNYKEKIIGNVINEKKIKDIREKIMNEIDEAFIYAKNSPFPNIELLNKHIYKN